jgi:succinate dehydrogenase/fumarate reductase flavoprotein subunit
VVPEFHAGPIRVGLNCETTIPGLYAVGDACQNGSAYTGALEGCGLTGGTPLSFAAVTGFRSGTAAGKTVADIPKPEFNTLEVEKLKREITAPLGVKEGYSPYDAIKEIQEVTFKLRNSYIKHKDRLEEALGMVENVKSKLPTLKAKDSHELVRCHEAKSMAINAEILYRASLMRTETRGTNIREDYPQRDDKNWLKWIILRKEGEKMKLWTEPVPIEKYRYKPR